MYKSNNYFQRFHITYIHVVFRMEVSYLLLKYKMGIVVVTYEDHCCWYAIFKIPSIKTIIFNLFTKNPAFAISNCASFLTKNYDTQFHKTAKRWALSLRHARKTLPVFFYITSYNCIKSYI